MISPVRIQLLYKRAARLFWKSSYGPMIPGLHNGYALTVFNTEAELVSAVQKYEYSELFPNFQWKVGTAEITDIRLKRMFGAKCPLVNLSDIWERYYIPFGDRLSKYQGDTKSLAAGQCAFMKEVLINKFVTHGTAAILMLPLIIGFKGTTNNIEEQMSEMIVAAGGSVYNDKKKQASKIRAATTKAQMNLADIMPDKLLPLTPTLEKLGFEIHPQLKTQ